MKPYCTFKTTLAFLVLLGLPPGGLWLMPSASAKTSPEDLQLLFSVNREEAEWLKNAQATHEKGQGQQAEKELLAQIKPESSLTVFMNLAKIQWDNQSYVALEKSLLHVLHLVPEYLPCLQQLVQLYLQQERFDEALKPTLTIVQLQPDAKAYGLLGQNYFLRKDFVRSESAYRQACLLNPEHRQYYLGFLQCLAEQQRWRECVSLCRTELEKIQDNFSLWTILIHALHSMGQPKEALIELELARHYCPQPQLDPWVLDLYLDMDMLPQSKEIFETQKNKLTLSEALRWGLKFMRLKDLSSVKLCLDYGEKYFMNNKTTIDSSQKFKWLMLKARYAEEQGLLSEATNLYKEALLLNPCDPFLLLHLSQSIVEHDLEFSKSLLERAIQLESVAPQAYLYLGDLYARQKKWPEALQSIRKSLQLRPNNSTQQYYDNILKLSSLQ